MGGGGGVRSWATCKSPPPGAVSQRGPVPHRTRFFSLCMNLPKRAGGSAGGVGTRSARTLDVPTTTAARTSDLACFWWGKAVPSPMRRRIHNIYKGRSHSELDGHERPLGTRMPLIVVGRLKNTRIPVASTRGPHIGRIRTPRS